MTKRVLLVISLALVMAWATPSAADTFTFDANGGGAGGGGTFAYFDWLPGNSLLVETAGSPIATIYFQANLDAAVKLDNTKYNNCDLAGGCITAVAAFQVLLTPITTTQTNFTVLPGGVLKVYADTTQGDDLSGLGFAAGGSAVDILTATTLGGSGTFNFSSLTPVPLDQSPDGNNYPNTLTYTGQGSTDITALVTAVNSAYFTNLIAGASLSFTNTSQIDPYKQVNPSATFSSNAIADGDVCGVPCVGPINGAGDRIVAQSDANTSFTVNAPIPEPATLTLFGLGLAGTAAARRRQKKSKA